MTAAAGHWGTRVSAGGRRRTWASERRRDAVVAVAEEAAVVDVGDEDRHVGQEERAHGVDALSVAGRERDGSVGELVVADLEVRLAESACTRRDRAGGTSQRGHGRSSRIADSGPTRPGRDAPTTRRSCAPAPRAAGWRSAHVGCLEPTSSVSRRRRWQKRSQETSGGTPPSQKGMYPPPRTSGGTFSVSSRSRGIPPTAILRLSMPPIICSLGKALRTSTTSIPAATSIGTMPVAHPPEKVEAGPNCPRRCQR